VTDRSVSVLQVLKWEIFNTQKQKLKFSFSFELIYLFLLITGVSSTEPAVIQGISHLPS